AQRFNHNYVGTEHVLLGLVRLGDGTAAQVLVSLGVELQRVRAGVEFRIARDDLSQPGDIGLTPRAKKVVELAVDEARRLDHHYIGTEHLLLGMICEGEGIAAGVLESLGLTLEKVRAETVRVLSQTAHKQMREAHTTPMILGPAPAPRGDNVVTISLSDQTLDAIDMLVEAGIGATRGEAAAWLLAAGIAANRDLFT
ncbi:MAG: Clp protease N-terminal domain-containing protein, partial [Ktedonobacterales bacterium]